MMSQENLGVSFQQLLDGFFRRLSKLTTKKPSKICTTESMRWESTGNQLIFNKGMYCDIGENVALP